MSLLEWMLLIIGVVSAYHVVVYVLPLVLSPWLPWMFPTGDRRWRDD